MGLRLGLLLLLLALSSTGLTMTQYTVRVIDKKPQSRLNFVQGLEIHDGILYVSSGNYGESRLLRYRFADGKLDRVRNLDARVFAEGLTVLGDHLYQLTWRNKTMYVYDKTSLQPSRSLSLPGEGWGLTNNGRELIYTDGGAQLHFMSARSGKILRSVTVTDRGRSIIHLNELEWIDGSIWANIWQTNRIVIINPENGEVTGNIDLSGLLPATQRRRNTDVLNGIAQDPADGAIWVTGKRWPWLYQVELVPTRDKPQPTSISR